MATTSARAAAARLMAHPLRQLLRSSAPTLSHARPSSASGVFGGLNPKGGCKEAWGMRGMCSAAPIPPLIRGADQLLRRNVHRFRGGLVFKAHRRVYHSTLGSRVIKKKKKLAPRGVAPRSAPPSHDSSRSPHSSHSPHSRAPNPPQSRFRRGAVIPPIHPNQAISRAANFTYKLKRPSNKLKP